MSWLNKVTELSLLFHPSAFDLVNIHLFHDASNLVAWEKSPSVYSGTRQKALGYVLDRYFFHCVSTVLLLRSNKHPFLLQP